MNLVTKGTTRGADEGSGREGPRQGAGMRTGRWTGGEAYPQHSRRSGAVGRGGATSRFGGGRNSTPGSLRGMGERVNVWMGRWDGEKASVARNLRGAQ